MQRFVGERAIDVQWKSMSNGFDIKSIEHRFPLDINCGSPANRRTTDTVSQYLSRQHFSFLSNN